MIIQSSAPWGIPSSLPERLGPSRAGRRFVDSACKGCRNETLSTHTGRNGGWVAPGARRWRRLRCWQLAPWWQWPPPRRYRLHPPRSSSSSGPRWHQRFTEVMAPTRCSPRARRHRLPLRVYANDPDESRLELSTATTSSTLRLMTFCRQWTQTTGARLWWQWARRACGKWPRLS